MDTVTELPMPLVFQKQALAPISFEQSQQPLPPIKSRISTLIALEKEKASANPFSKKYSFLCGKGERNPISLKIYVPNATDNPTIPMLIVVKRDATVEETIGYALYVFIEEKRLPLFNTWAVANRDVAAWNIRIVEEDGDIDEDFPGNFCFICLMISLNGI